MPRRKPDDGLNPEYDEGYDPEADKRPLKDRGKYPADVVSLPDQSSWFWRHNPEKWRRSLYGRLLLEGKGDGRTLLELVAGRDLTLRQIRDEYGTDHWLWTGARQADGRAVIRIKGKRPPVTRVLWTMFRGGNPDTRLVAHRTCDHTECVNPMHAELVKRGSWLQ